MAFQFLDSLIADTRGSIDSDNEAESDLDLDNLDLDLEVESDSDTDGDIDLDLDVNNSVSVSTVTEASPNDNVADPRSSTESLSWTNTLTSVSDQMLPFDEIVGGVHYLEEDCSPLDYFKLFITDEMIGLMVTETNRYAEQQQVAKGQRDSQWKPVTAQDIYTFLYINIMFGIHWIPSTKLYWSSDKSWRVPAIADVMGRTRFEKIRQYFHLNDSAHFPPRNSDNYDPLYKIRPLLDHVRSTCQAVYKPQRKLSVDEAMVGFRGRLAMKQYLKNKPTPWGIKIWCCAEASSGYVLNFRVYTGKSNYSSPNGLGYNVVMSMTEPYLDKYHEVYFDNFFSSLKLAEDLLERKTYSCATIRARRKGWPLPKSKQKKGDLKMRQKGLIVATQWTDKRQVNILSTNSDPVMTTVERRSKTGMLDVEIPLPVVNYNSGMFGVDLADQHRSYYPVGRVSNKWWRYMLWYLIDISMINSFLLMKKSRPNDSTDSLSQNHLLFHKKVADQLLTAATGVTLLDTPSVAGRSKPYNSHHMLQPMPGRKRRCFQCSKDGNKTASGRTSETRTGCHMCQVHLHRGLCYSVIPNFMSFSGSSKVEKQKLLCLC
uniref:PiggyBac transposable element-derived protein domain-containing protein n=1 Tax=Biomphalaria glabrata TaxID=6526 RepID=A0A2C9KGK8_BIOGL